MKIRVVEACMYIRHAIIRVFNGKEFILHRKNKVYEM